MFPCNTLESPHFIFMYGLLLGEKKKHLFDFQVLFLIKLLDYYYGCKSYNILEKP